MVKIKKKNSAEQKNNKVAYASCRSVSQTPSNRKPGGASITDTGNKAHGEQTVVLTLRGHGCGCSPSGRRRKRACDRRSPRRSASHPDSQICSNTAVSGTAVSGDAFKTVGNTNTQWVYTHLVELIRFKLSRYAPPPF